MSTFTQHGARFIVLGLSVTQVGAQAVVAMAEEPGSDLAGLVAPDAPVSPRAVNGVNAIDATPEPAGCDPSGCAASYSIERIERQVDRLPGTQDVVYMRVRSFGPAIVEDALLRVDTGLGATIVDAPGCTVVTSSRVECELGDIAPFEDSGASIVLEAVESQYSVESVVVSPTSNNSSSSNNWFASVNTFALLPRFTSVDAAACPLIEGHVVRTNTSGEWVPFDSGSQVRVSEDGRFTPSVSAPSSDTPLSFAIIIDNAAERSPGDWDIVRQRVSDFVLDWQTWAIAEDVPAPAFALYTTGPATRELDFSTEAGAIDAQLQAIERGERASSLYQTLDLAALDLSSRQGRRIALLISASTDADGAVGRDAMITRLNEREVNAYGIAIEDTSKNLLRELSDATAGFAHVPGSVSGLQGALNLITGEIRGSTRQSWLTPFQDASYRDVEIRPDNGWFAGIRGYQPVASPCATACAVVRDMPARYSRGVPNIVSLTLNPSLFVAPVTLTETLPQDWSAESISHGGQYDQTTHSVVWSFSEGSVPTSLSYSAFTTFVWADTRERVSGQFKDSNGAQRVCGDSTLSPLLSHPADRFGQGSIVYMGYEDYLDSYARAWRYGSQWIDGPRQIEVAYVTRTVQIARLGGNYVRVDESPPWRSAVEPPVAGPRASQRSVSALTQPGQPVTVQLAVDPGSNSQAYAVEEVIPPGWQVQSVGGSGHFDGASRTIRWGPFEGDGARILSYTISSPDANSAVLVGRFSVDGVNTPIDGTNSIGDDALFADGFD